MAAPILSRENERLIRSLHRGEGRSESGAFLVEGIRALEELAREGITPRILFAIGDELHAVQHLFPADVVHSVRGDGRALFATKQAQGVGAVVDIPSSPSLSQLLAHIDRSLLYLDRVSDPDNVG